MQLLWHTNSMWCTCNVYYKVDYFCIATYYVYDIILELHRLGLKDKARFVPSYSTSEEYHLENLSPHSWSQLSKKYAIESFMQLSSDTSAQPCPAPEWATHLHTTSVLVWRFTPGPIHIIMHYGFCNFPISGLCSFTGSSLITSSWTHITITVTGRARRRTGCVGLSVASRCCVKWITSLALTSCHVPQNDTVYIVCVLCIYLFLVCLFFHQVCMTILRLLFL